MFEALTLRRDASVSLQDQLAAFVRDAIRSGCIALGEKLPPSRQLAATLAVSRTTVVEAFEQLAAEGWVESRARAGLFVAARAPANGTGDRATNRASAAGPGAPPARPRLVTRQPVRASAHAGFSYGTEYDLPLAPGVPAIDRFPWHDWTRLSARVLRRPSARLVGWGDPRGELPLRAAIADHLAEARGIDCEPNQVIIGSGSQPLVEMLVRSIAAPGDAMWFEEPGDPASRAVLQNLGLEPVPIPVDAEGLNVDNGRIAAPRARLALVAPSHHYPLGIPMSDRRRRALVDWAANQRAWIIENEIDADYRFVTHAPRSVFALDTAERVIYLGSFNKAIAPGLRIGYAVVPRSLVGRLAPLTSTVGVPNQLMLARFWSDGHLRAHLKTLAEVHTRRRELLLEALRTEAPGLLAAALPEAGLRLPIGMPGDRSDEAAARACVAAGIKVGRPFSTCYAGRPRQSGVTIGFASTREEVILPAVARLASVLRAATGTDADRRVRA